MAIDLEKFLKAKRFTTDHTLDDATDQVLVKTTAGSSVGDAIAAAVAGATIADATDTVAGKVTLAVAANMPSTSDTEAATPAAVNAAIAANNTAMGASAAETIAGTEAAKFISPDDLKAALRARAVYPIDVKAAGTNGSFAVVAVGSEASGTQSGGLQGAVVGINTATGEGAKNGIYGVMTGTTSRTDSASLGEAAVRGTNQVAGSAGTAVKIGTLGVSDGAGGINMGVYGTSLNGATNWAGYFDGNVFYSGTLTPSDSRLKSDFKAAPVLGALKIQSFDKHYVTRDDAGNEEQHSVGRQVGIIAQDLQAVAPELVEEAGGYLAVKETSVLFALIAELQSKVAALEGAVL